MNKDICVVKSVDDKKRIVARTKELAGGMYCWYVYSMEKDGGPSTTYEEGGIGSHWGCFEEIVKRFNDDDADWDAKDIRKDVEVGNNVFHLSIRNINVQGGLYCWFIEKFSDNREEKDFDIVAKGIGGFLECYGNALKALDEETEKCR